MTDEPALLAAITAHAEEDTPRLVYADWLDEHDAPLQAEFIRVQCRLASSSAADPDYPDLLERHTELVAQFRPMANVTVPKLPPGFVSQSAIEHGADHFRRGFLHTVSGEWSNVPSSNPTDEQIEGVCAGLAPLIANTTVRNLVLQMMTPDLLARVLVAPGAQALTNLAVQSSDFSRRAEGDALVAVLARSKSVINLEGLALWIRASVTGLSVLGRTKFARLRSLDFPRLRGAAGEIPALTRAEWFRGLRYATAGDVGHVLQEPLLAAFAGLPHLESLALRFSYVTAMKAFGTATGFPALARLIFSWRTRTTTILPRGRFPRLAELAVCDLGDDSFLPLLAAKWFPQLRVLNLSNGGLTNKSVVALAKSGAAQNLRILRIGFNRFGAVGLRALANGARFANLTTLDIGTSNARAKAVPLARFAAELNLPRLRHLNLDGWPLGDAGAKALSANPSLANLTRLSIRGCEIGEKGFTALVRSPHLQQLIELDVGNNTLKKAGALLDPARLPRLAAVGLYGNPLTGAAREKLHRARGWIV